MKMMIHYIILFATVKKNFPIRTNSMRLLFRVTDHNQINRYAAPRRIFCAYSY